MTVLSSSFVPRIAIIGAGPAGLEAAVYARALGWRIHVFERESVPAFAVKEWAHVAMFTDWASNSTPLGWAAVEQMRPRQAETSGTVYPMGRDFAERYLDPIARSLGTDLHLQTRVVAAGRAFRFAREAHTDARARSRFRILTRSPREERIFNADFLVDATGTTHSPNWLGAGGVPAQGEQGATGPLFRGVPDAAGRDRIHFLGKKVLLVGDGASAATVAAAVRPLLSHDPPMTLFWAVPHTRPLPLPYQPNDPLPRRDLVFQQANLLVASALNGVHYLPAMQVDALQFDLNDRQFAVTLQGNGTTKRLHVDTVVACVGYRAQSQTWERVLHADEPGVFTVGAKAVQNDAVQVLASVREQIRQAFQSMTGDPTLNLYGQDSDTPPFSRP